MLDVPGGDFNPYITYLTPHTHILGFFMANLNWSLVSTKYMNAKYKLTVKQVLSYNKPYQPSNL